MVADKTKSNPMRNAINELHSIVNTYAEKTSALSPEEFSAKPSPHKWSKKEVLGHLIDSACTNLRRFVCGQYEAEPPHIVYQQDFWVSANGYQDTAAEEVIQLWRLINLRICAVLERMPEENYTRQCLTDTLHTLEWLAEDYVKHMKHHLNQIFPASFDVVYP